MIKNLYSNLYQFTDQYFYGEKVGVYLIAFEDKTVLFEIPTFNEELLNELSKFPKPFISVLSHGSTGISDGAIWQEKLGLQIYLHKNDEHQNWLEVKPDVLFSEDPKINEDLEIIETPGHSKGSICMLHKSSKTLFTGDTIGGVNGEIRDFFHENDDTKTRFESCKKLLNYDFENILPFHYGQILNSAKERLGEFCEIN